MEKVSTSEGIRRVNSFFSKLESVAESFQNEFCQQSRFEKVHKLLPSAGMVVKGLEKMHQKIIRQLHVKPRLAKPWFGEFVMDMPSEVFSCLSEGIIQCTNFGHEFIEINTQLIFKIQYCAKVMQMKFDEFRSLFSQTFERNFAQFRAKSITLKR